MPAERSTPERDPRVRFAMERTFLAWTRTALALMGFGFIVARLGLMMRELAAASGGPGTVQSSAGAPMSIWLGAALVVLGILVQGFAIREHRYLLVLFRRGDPVDDVSWPLSTMLATALIVIGVGLAMYILQSA